MKHNDEEDEDEASIIMNLIIRCCIVAFIAGTFFGILISKTFY